jgi:hypothetical protein
MKTNSLPPVTPPFEGRAGPVRSGADEPEPAARVTLSRDAAFVASLREKAGEPPFRPELIADVKQQLAAGTFEQQSDLDKVVDGLLADL